MPNGRIAIYDILATDVVKVLEQYADITVGECNYEDVSSTELMTLLNNASKFVVFDIHEGFALLKFTSTTLYILRMDEGTSLYKDLKKLTH